MSESSMGEPTPVASDARDVLAAYFAELEAGRFDAAQRHYAADGVGTSHGQFGPSRREEVVEFTAQLLEAFPDLAFEVLDILAEDDVAVSRWRLRGTFTGPGRFMGFRPTGAAFEVEGLDIAWIADGKIKRIDGYADGMTVARQLGLVPQTGSTAERVMAAAVNARTVVAQRLSRAARR